MAFSFDYDESEKIVLDNGSSSIKAGIAGDVTPQAVIPAVIGRSRYDKYSTEIKCKDQFIGKEALASKEILSIQYPIERGIVTNWDDMEKIWHYVFDDVLHRKSEEHPVLLTEHPLNPIANRQKMAQILFEQFNIPASYVAQCGVLAFYSLGRTAGIVLEIGDGVSYAMPINEGYSISNAINRLDLAGRDLTNYLMHLLSERGYSFSTTYERELIRDMKEKLAYVSQNFQEEMSTSVNNSKRFEKSYELPDGQKLKIGNEIFRCSEALFTPTVMGQRQFGIAELLHNSIMKCDTDIRPNFYCNCLLSGGTTLLPGLSSRLKKEMLALVSPTQRIRIVEANDREYSVWIGGSIICSLSSFQYQWILRKEYDDIGPSIFYRKCY